MSREQFEAWAEQEKLSLAYGDCDYVYSSTAAAWRAWQAASKASEQQLAAVIAENAGLKSAMSITLEHVSVMDTGQAGVAALIINDALHHSETPATDAYLAEVRASAIEYAASERWGSGYVFDELNEFAAQLRQGGEQ